MGDVMKFSEPLRAADGHGSGLTSYAKVTRVRPFQILINVIEAVLSLLGVVVLILLFRFGSFEKAGLVLDQSVGHVNSAVAKLIPKK